MVRNRAANRAKDLLGIMPLTFTTVFTSREASPVTVMHPATMPAMRAEAKRTLVLGITT